MKKSQWANIQKKGSKEIKSNNFCKYWTKNNNLIDGTERYDFWSRFLLLYSQKLYLSVPSIW